MISSLLEKLTLLLLYKSLGDELFWCLAMIFTAHFQVANEAGKLAFTSRRELSWRTAHR